MKKVCEIVNGHFSYFLRVDGREIPFSLGCNYFEEHYKSLGYKIVKSSEQLDMNGKIKREIEK